MATLCAFCYQPTTRTAAGFSICSSCATPLDEQIRKDERISPLPSTERHYSTRRGFIRACRRYRSRILAAITFTDGTFALVVTVAP